MPRVRSEVQVSALTLLSDEQRRALRDGELTIREAQELIEAAYSQVAVGVMPEHFEAHLAELAAEIVSSPADFDVSGSTGGEAKG